MSTPRVRVRTAVVPQPAPRIRTRTAPPVIPQAARVRVRSATTSEADPKPNLVLRSPGSIPLDHPKEAICTTGEVDPSRSPDKWHGWPNGSLVTGPGGRLHKGRCLMVKGVGFHVLRWHPFQKRYLYMGYRKTFGDAMLAL